MLAALAAVENPENMRVLERLFAKGDVNAKASQVSLLPRNGRGNVLRADAVSPDCVSFAAVGINKTGLYR